ncbi:MAG: hypothetical protein HON40_03160 [Flavobacteriales bacterium]|nr:hypothetical protein [Flavobacteriales bacterium]
MKKLLLLFLFISVGINAQFNYQAIVKDSDGNPVTNNQVKFKFSLMYQSATASPVFVEEHDITTPADGVVNLSVGGGTVVNGTFSNIDWSNSVFMKEELDTGSGYQDMGTRQISSVPVAEYAKVTNISSSSFIKGLGDIIIGSESPDYLQDTIDFFEIVPGAVGGNIMLGKNILSSRASTDTSYSPTGNIIIGNDAMSESKSGGSIAIGYSAMSNSASSSDIAIGFNALKVSEGFQNIAIGIRSFDELESGSGNIGIGKEVGFNFYGGNHNVGIGYRAFGSSYEKANTVTNTTFNTGVGYGSSYGLVGINNSSFGRQSGQNTLGDKNTLIGAYATTSENIEINNATAIGADATVTASNTIQLGNVSVTLVNTSAAISANDYLINGGESLVDIVSQLPSSDDYAALTAEVAEIDIQTDSLSSTQSDIAALSSQIDALLAAVDDLDIQTNSLSSTLSESNTSEIKSAQVVINSNDVVLFELGVLRFSWNNTYNTIQVKQSSSYEIVDNWYISGIINSGTETYIQKSNMTYGLGDDGGYNDRFTPIWSNGFTSLMDGSIALGSAYSNFEFYITPMGSGSTPYDPVPTWQLRGHVDGYNQLTVTCIHAKFDGTSGW